MNYAKHSFELLRSECREYLKKEVPDDLLEVTTRSIDQFLVDGRRQIRIWKKDMMRLKPQINSAEAELRKWQSNISFAQKNNRSDLAEKAQKLVRTLEITSTEDTRRFSALESYSELLATDLSELENCVQVFKQRCQQKSSPLPSSDSTFDPLELL